MFPEAICFDLDDTIVSFSSGSEQAWVQVCNEFFAKYRYFRINEIFKAIIEYQAWYWSDEKKSRTGRNNMNLAIRQIVIAAFKKLGINNRKYAFEIADNYLRKRLENLTLFPGANETLEALCKKKIKLALITNGDPYTQRYKIKKFNLEKYFEQIVIEGEVGYGKPDVKIYQHALTAMNQNPKDVWMVGDNLEWDIEAPQKLGVFSIWVDYKMEGLRPQSSFKPDRIIQSIHELL